MAKVRRVGVETPCLYLIDSANTKIYMEKVDGVTAKQFLLDCLHSEYCSASTILEGYSRIALLYGFGRFI